MLRLLTAIAGPVFAKELIEMSRRKRYFFLRLLYGLLLLFVVYCIWEQQTRYHYYDEELDIKVMARLASHIFMGIAIFQYSAVYLLVPVALSATISSEREEHTLDLLFTTQLLDREIVLGKLLSRISVVLLIIFSGLPIMALIMLWGGIEFGQLIRSQTATLLAILFTGACTIYFSVTSRTITGTLIRTYWWMALYLGGLPAIAGILISSIRPSGPSSPIAYTLWYQLFINPVMQFSTSLEPQIYQQMQSYSWEHFFWYGFPLPILFSLLLIYRAVRCLRIGPVRKTRWISKPKKRSASQKISQTATQTQAAKVPNESVEFASETLTTVSQIDLTTNAQESANTEFSTTESSTTDQAKELPQTTSIPKEKTPKTWWGYRVRNPFWLRARQSLIYDRGHYFRRIQRGGLAVALFFFGLIALLNPSDLSDDEAMFGFVGIAWLIVFLMAAVLAGSCVVGDRRRGFLELVLTTPVKPTELFDGMILAVGHHLRLGMFCVFLLAVLFYFTNAAFGLGILVSMISGILCLLSLIGTGVICSLAAKSAAQALIPTVGLAVVVLIGVIFSLPLFQEYSGLAIFLAAIMFVFTGWIWTRYQMNPFSIGIYLIGMHVLILICCMFWTNPFLWKPFPDDRYYAPGKEYPAVAMNPVQYLLAPLPSPIEYEWEYDASGNQVKVWKWESNTIERWSNRSYRGAGEWHNVILCYWYALILYIVWMRFWIGKYFDRITGRIAQLPSGTPDTRRFGPKEKVELAVGQT